MDQMESSNGNHPHRKTQSSVVVTTLLTGIPTGIGASHTCMLDSPDRFCKVGKEDNDKAVAMVPSRVVL